MIQARLAISAAILICFFFSFENFAQKISILSPNKGEQNIRFADKIAEELATKFNVQNSSMSEAAFNSVQIENPFNLSLVEAKKIGAVMGCDFFVLTRSETLRRAAIDKPDYYESYAAVFVASTRTGRLVYWKLVKAEKSSPDASEKSLFDNVGEFVSKLTSKVKAANKSELTEPASVLIEEVPDENSSAAKNFRAPVPYKRIKPEYASLAYLYDIKATVDIMVDLDENGKILRTEITRWAGFGLDESVTEAIKMMNWLPAKQNGKTLPIRFVVRYNFKKIEKE